MQLIKHLDNSLWYCWWIMIRTTPLFLQASLLAWGHVQQKVFFFSIFNIYFFFVVLHRFNKDFNICCFMSCNPFPLFLAEPLYLSIICGLFEKFNCLLVTPVLCPDLRLFKVPTKAFPVHIGVKGWDARLRTTCRQNSLSIRWNLSLSFSLSIPHGSLSVKWPREREKERMTDERGGCFTW